MAQCLEDLVPVLSRRDVPSRLNTYNQLVALLSDPGTRVAGEAVDRIVDAMDEWMAASNFKITLCGIEVLSLLIDRLESHFYKHVGTVLGSVRDRLGDNKDQVREEARRLLLRLMNPASTPQHIWDKCVTSLTSHKLPRVREELLVLLGDTLNNYGHQSLQLSKLVPHVLKLLDDTSTPVRDAAYNAILEVYRHVGERVRSDLLRRGLPQHKLQPLFAGFDQLRDEGQMVEDSAELEAQMSKSVSSAVSTDDTDFARPAALPAPRSRQPSNASVHSATGGVSSGTLPPSGAHGLTAKRSAPRATSVGHKEAGAVDVELFEKAFTEQRKVQVHSARDLQDLTSRVKDIIGSANTDWEKRIEAMKEVRGVLGSEAVELSEFSGCLRVLEPSFQQACKDLRSQVVREACVTVAFGAVQLKSRFDHFAESVLPTLVSLVPNSAKVMATAGSVCIRFLILNVQAPRLVPLLTGQLTSKSRDIRRTCCEVLALLLSEWPARQLERNLPVLLESIKRALTDADAETRSHARRAYWALAEHFPDQAEVLMSGLDPKNQKALQSELSRTSSTNSLNSAASASAALVGGGSRAQRSRVSSAASSGYGKSSNARRTLDTSTRPRMTLTPAKPQAEEPVNGSRTGRQFRVSQSQPSSRSTSPTSKTSYLTYNADRSTRRSGIPRSQGASRESSPGRSSTAGATSRQSSSSSTAGRYGGRAQRLLPHGAEGEAVVRDALSQPHRATRRYDQHYDSDDAGSEISVGSDLSYGAGSRASERGNYGQYRLTSPEVQGVPDAIILLSSQLWSERRQGLTALSNLLNAGKNLSRSDLRRVCDLFTRMFHDPHGKVFSAFLDTLQDLVKTHRTFLYDWMSVLIPRLLLRSGSEMLGSVAVKLQRALDVTRECFPSDRQFNVVCKFIIDQTAAPNVKVKLAVLQYLLALSGHMDPAEFVHTGETRIAVTRIIQWCSEPKSSDMRKTAQEVLVALFNLNTPEFSALLSVLSKSAQDGATRVLRTTVPRQPEASGARAHHNNAPVHDIYESFRQTTADIQNLSLGAEPGHESQDSGIHTLHDARPESPERGQHGAAERPAYNPSQYADSNGRSPALARPPPSYQPSPPTGHQPSPQPHTYQRINTSVNGYNKQALAEALFDNDDELLDEEMPDMSDPVQEIMAELSHHNARYGERQAAMARLVELSRDHSKGMWDEHFKTVLLLLLETMGDTDGHTRALAVGTLKELVRELPSRFADFVELTVLRVLDAHRDPIKEVVRAAEECASAVATSVAADQSIPVLAQIVYSQQYPVSLAAIKMLNKVLDEAGSETTLRFLPELMPGLLKGYDDVESTVRKAAVFCIVSIYMSVGDRIREHLDHLNSSKLKLLNLYIKRAQSQRTTHSESSSRAMSGDS